MKRRLIMEERIMYIDADTPLNCVFAVKLRGNFTAETLRGALFKIQQKHPLLRSSITEYEGVPYFILGNSINEIPVRMVERLGDDDWKLQSEKEWGKLFDSENMPLARVVWLKGEQVSELLLVCPHCVCDGTTIVTLMRELLMLLDQPDKELDTYQLFNSIEDLLEASFLRSKKQIAKGKVFALLARLFFLLKLADSKKPAGKGYMLHWKLSPEMTTALITVCKDRATTVHAALCVAFLEAFRQVKGAKTYGKVICPVDVRKFVQEIKNDHMFAFAPIVELSIDKGDYSDLWVKARKLKDDLTRKIAAIEICELLIMLEYLHGSVKKIIKSMRLTKGTHDLTLSNMGKLSIEEHYSSFVVETIYSPTVGFPWRNPNTLVVSTFKGEMDFTFYSNDAFLKEEDVLSIKQKALELLLWETEVSYV